MSLFPDPVSDLIGVFFKRALDSKIMQYVTLVLEMGIAASIAMLAAAGVPLALGKPGLVSLGIGMIAAAVALLATFQASKNSRGLIISLPSAAAEEKLNSNITTIERK